MCKLCVLPIVEITICSDLGQKITQESELQRNNMPHHSNNFTASQIKSIS